MRKKEPKGVLSVGGVLALAVFASSVVTKEHTGKQLLGGSMIAFVCIFVLSVAFRSVG